MTIRSILLSILLITLVAGYGHAQATPPSELETLKLAVRERDRALAEISTRLAQNNDLSADQKKIIAEAKTKALVSFFEGQESYNQNGNRLREHQQRVFAWQIMAANCLLAVVMVVSLSGVLFAGYEMVSTRKLISRGPIAAEAMASASMQAKESVGGEPPPVVPGQGASTVITIEPTKIHITSAVIGIIILTISLAFLYLFLREVYAIKVFEITDTGAAKIISTREVKDGESVSIQGQPDASASN